VLGAAGGVGAAAVELGKAMGAHVIAAASTNDKVQFALELGADNGLIYPAGQDGQGGPEGVVGRAETGLGPRRSGRGL
jgi:NADPH2:quinone reductase